MSTEVIFVLLKLLVVDAIFLLVLALFAGALSNTKRAAYAVMRRNFVGYFSNPTGYVFLCIFVFLTSVAAFWPYEFFNQNLATLDQLNMWYPLIMLVFIPAITMSIWAEEKRQGTDELLLTLPADDFDIVIGKYMAAAAIFTASLLFSQLSTFITLAILTAGEVDTGLIFTTYLGYWFVGLTMIAIGMVASFLTGNLTVGFILGALFNAPLAFASMSKAIIPNDSVASFFSQSGLSRSFDDFGRGVVSSSSVVYFILAASVALYLCMVLIGRRHWTGGKDGNTMAWHYMARTLALVCFTGGSVVVARNFDFLRFDATEGKVSSLAGATKDLIGNLDPERVIKIDAFISEEIPEQYAQTRYELVNLLKEFESEANKGGRAIEVTLHDNIKTSSEDAELAEKRFGIVPVERRVREKGSPQVKKFILGAAFRSGLEKVTVPIFEYGIPVEYELVRSIDTVSKGKRKRIGIVATDAQLMGGFTMAGMSPQQIPKHPIVDELEKQYDVEPVDFMAPIESDRYDALLAVQPSSMSPEAFQNFMQAVEAGVPAAIYEDPAPNWGTVTPTGEMKQAGGGMFGGGQPQPKGDINQLWNLLELDIPGEPSMQGLLSPDLVWQDYNPYPEWQQDANELFVFVDDQLSEDASNLSDENPITSGNLREVLLLFAGCVNSTENATLQHTPLLTTGARTGRISNRKLQAAMRSPLGRRALQRELGDAMDGQVMAMAIESPGAASDETSTDEAGDGETEAGGIKAVYVADIDLMLPQFLQLRRDPNLAEIKFQFQNVTFLLNTIDWLTGEYPFLEIRKHQPIFSSLTLIERVKDDASRRVTELQDAIQESFDAEISKFDEEQDRLLQKSQERMDKLQKQAETGTVDRAELQLLTQEFQIKKEAIDRAKQVQREKSQRELESEVDSIRRDADMDVERIQNLVKALAVSLPCIPPLIVGVVVFSSRRLRERDSITKARLK